LISPGGIWVTPKNSTQRAGMVILDELSWQSQGFELVRPENLSKKPAIILEHLRNKNANLSKLSRLDSYVHDFTS
jgi:hypothetical protein